jgi:hypothetical protein
MEVLDAILAATWKARHGTGYLAEIARTTDGMVLYDLMMLSANEHAAEQVRAIALLKLEEPRGWLATALNSATEEERAHPSYAVSQIVQFQKDPKKMELIAPAEPPDGPPYWSGRRLGWLGLIFPQNGT